jgi:hypothetical protein
MPMLAKFLTPISTSLFLADISAKGNSENSSDGAAVFDSMSKVVSANAWPHAVEYLILFGAIVGIVALVIWGRLRRVRLEHETLQIMVEKGAPIPADIFQRKAPRNDLRRGLVWIAVGAGFFIFALSTDMRAGAWSLGVIPMLIGGAFLLARKLEKTDSESRNP